MFRAKANYEPAIADFQRHLDLGGGVRDGDQQAVEEKIRDLKKKLTASQKKTKINEVVKPRKKK